MRSGGPQFVTKKLVNRKVGLPKKERGRIRSALHELLQTNFEDPEYPKRFRSVRGRINHLASFHATLGKEYLEKMTGLKNPDKS